MRTIGIWPLSPGTDAYVEANGLWSDDGCRAIALVLFSVPRLRRRDVDGPPGATLGAWTVVQDASDPCTTALTGPGGCLEYESQPIGRNEQILILQMRGIGREEGDAIALSIPTGHLHAHSLG